MGYFVEGQIFRDQHIGHHVRVQALVQRLSTALLQCNRRSNYNGVMVA